MTKNQDIFMTLVILLNNNDINKFKEMIYKHSEYDFSYKDNTYQDTILHNIFLHKNFNKEYLDLLDKKFLIEGLGFSHIRICAGVQIQCWLDKNITPKLRKT